MTTAWGRGLATITDDGTVLDTWFRELGLGDEPQPEALEAYTTAARRDDVRRVSVRAVQVHIDTDSPPTSASDVYLRLHLLSHRLMVPRTINLDMRAQKTFNIAEKYNLELIGEAFNLANHQNVTGVNTTGYILNTSSTNPAAR